MMKYLLAVFLAVFLGQPSLAQDRFVVPDQVITGAETPFPLG